MTEDTHSAIEGGAKVSAGAPDSPPGASAPLPRILTTHNKNFHPAWTARTTLLPGWYEAHKEIAPFDFGVLDSLRWAWQLFRLSPRYDAVVTGSEHTGHLFAILQSLLRTRRRRVPHVMIDFPWAASPGKLTIFLKRIQMSIESRSIYRIFAHASPEEAERFARELRTRRDLFQFVIYHDNLRTPRPEVKDGGYLFSGGFEGRDYPTLLRAIMDAPYPAVICSPWKISEGGELPPHISVSKVTPERFDELMAAAKVVVLSLFSECIHTSGHTVIANALSLGKPLVVAAPQEFRHYIDHGVNGILVPPGDSQALRQAIDHIFRDPEYTARLAANAKNMSARFSREIFFQTVYDTVEAAVRERQSQYPSRAQHI